QAEEVALKQKAMIDNIAGKIDHGLPVIGAISGVVLVGYAFARFSRKSKDTSYGSARFAERSDIKDLLRSMFKAIPSGELRVGKWNERWQPTHKHLNLTRRLITRHVLILGPSGSGKSRAIFLPNCHYNHGASFIATDPKSELFNFTSGRQSHPLRFAPSDP